MLNGPFPMGYALQRERLSPGDGEKQAADPAAFRRQQRNA